MAGFVRFARLSLGAAGALAAAFAPGCRQPVAAPAASARVQPAYDRETGRLERITYDRNGDGRVDATTVMDGTAVVRAELDQDYDGRVDRREHYAPAAGGSGETRVLQKVETSTRLDGATTRWELYDGGLLHRVEEDTDGNGRIDKWETWDGGVLRAVALDTTGRGTADRRLVYPAGGGEPTIEVDRDGTGTFTPAPAAR